MTSHDKKKYDRIHHRNYYAKDLAEDKYHQRVVTTKEQKFTQKDLKELADEEDQD